MCIPDGTSARSRRCRAEAGRQCVAVRLAIVSRAARSPSSGYPDAFEFIIDAIPRTSAGKFKKSALRERSKDYRLSD